MTRTVSTLVPVLLFSLCGNLLWLSSTQVRAEPGDPERDLLKNVRLNKISHAFRYRSDHYRDPFLPKSGFRNNAGLSLQRQDVTGRCVKVVGIMSSAKGRWAILELEDEKRLIVRARQVLSAYSQVVKRITDQGVTLSSVQGKTSIRSQPEETYLLYEERDFFEPSSGGSSCSSKP